MSVSEASAGNKPPQNSASVSGGEAPAVRSDPETIRVTVDGVVTEVVPGTLLIEAALKAGRYIPHFCWHPRMKPVAKCRMCLVEVEDQRGLPPACTTQCAPDMVVHTDSPLVQQAQESVLELLLANHPLDCPVCDRGGECPLQDQAMAYGPGESRFVEEKRHFEKPIALSELVLLDRERCILCDRCSRFAEEIAGDPLIAFVERANRTHVLTFPDEPFRSYFSGNTIEMCPVGALTSVAYRFKARPWDLEEAESTCGQCAVGCRVKIQSSSSELVRVLGVDSDDVNHGWLCDKGRFGFDYVSSDSRLAAPLVREGDSLVEATWGEALDAAATGIRRAGREGPGALGFLGGALSTTESAYAFARLARIAGTNNIDAQLGDGLDPLFVAAASPRATISDVDTAGAIVLAAPDLKEELPVLFLRVKRAAEDLGVPLIECAPFETGLAKFATVNLSHRVGETDRLLEALADSASGDGIPRQIPAGAGVSSFQRAVEIISAGCDKGVVVIAGRTGLGVTDTLVGHGAIRLSQATGGKVLPVVHRANTVGALLAGCAPSILPGNPAWPEPHVEEALESEAALKVPEPAGTDATGILRAAAQGGLGALVLMGADPIGDFPDRGLALEALGRTGFIVAIDIFDSESVAMADVVLPAATFAEQAGSTVNIEARMTHQAQKISAPGTAQPEWYIADQLAARITGEEPRWAGPGDVLAELSKCGPAFAGVTASSLAMASYGGRGIVLPADSEGLVYVAGEAEPEPVVTDQYNHRVIAGRKLYGDGTVNTRSANLARIKSYATARICGRDADRLGVRAGTVVRLRNSRGDLEIPVEIDEAIPEGAVAVPFNRRVESAGNGGDDAPQTEPAAPRDERLDAFQPVRISDLIDAGGPVTEVRIETLEEMA